MRFFVVAFYLQWFRAFQQPHHFRFDKKQNLAIFAPNGSGKSSIVDGFEFALSVDGILTRFGNVNDYRLNRAGPDALRNIFAQGRDQITKVGIEIGRESLSTISSVRVLGDKERSDSRDYQNFLTELNVSSIIRGDELKSFVTDHSPVYRFGEVAVGLNLDEPYSFLKNYREILNDRLSHLNFIDEERIVLNSRVADITNQKVLTYNKEQIIKFINFDLLNPISAKLKLSRLDQLQSIFDTLCSRLLTDQESVLRNNETIDSQLDDSFQDTILIVGGLLYITQDYLKLQRREKKLKQEIRTLESTIKRGSQKLKTEVQNLIKQLNKPMNEYYQYIQGNTEQNIKLQIDSDKDTGQEHLKLAIKFVLNQEDLQPGGYLSNSQMHSFALAFRLASIKVLNPRVPILILDDIVNSYDAEYRNRIVSLISEKFHKFQIILFTHDELFYQMLMDKMGSENWSYNRIIRFHPNYGPVFRYYESIKEEMLRLWEDGHSALHLVRLIQENNAKKMVKDLGIKVSLLTSNTTRNHPRAELFRAIRAYP